MAIKTESIVINDTQYNVTQLVATKAVTMQVHLINTIGGDVAKIFSNQAKLADLFKNLEPEKVVSLMESFINSPCVTKKAQNDKGDDVVLPVNIDRDFSGDLTGLYALFFFVIEVNYKDFFLGSLLKLRPKLIAFFTLIMEAMAKD